MPKKVKREKLAEMLRQYQKENICEYASNQCKTCTFGINNNTGCAFNLVTNVLALNLSLDKERCNKQWREHLRLECEDQ